MSDSPPTPREAPRRDSIHLTRGDVKLREIIESHTLLDVNTILPIRESLLQELLGISTLDAA